MKLFGFFHLKGIGGQIAALVLASTVALHLVVTTAFLISRPDRSDTPPDGAHQLTDAALLLGSAEASERPRLVADLARAFPRLGIEMLAPGTASGEESDSLHWIRRPSRARLQGATACLGAVAAAQRPQDRGRDAG